MRTYRGQQKVEIAHGNLLKLGGVLRFHEMMPRLFDVSRAIGDVVALGVECHDGVRFVAVLCTNDQTKCMFIL